MHERTRPELPGIHKEGWGADNRWHWHVCAGRKLLVFAPPHGRAGRPGGGPARPARPARRVPGSLCRRPTSASTAAHALWIAPRPVRRFQERDGCRAALLSIQAAGVRARASDPCSRTAASRSPMLPRQHCRQCLMRVDLARSTARTLNLGSVVQMVASAAWGAHSVMN